MASSRHPKKKSPQIFWLPALIRKEADPADSRRHLYFLAEKGINLLPVVVELMQWMARFNPYAFVCAGNKKAYEKNRVGLYKELIAKLRKGMELKVG